MMLHPLDPSARTHGSTDHVNAKAAPAQVGARSKVEDVVEMSSSVRPAAPSILLGEDEHAERIDLSQPLDARVYRMAMDRLLRQRAMLAEVEGPPASRAEQEAQRLAELFAEAMDEVAHVDAHA